MLLDNSVTIMSGSERKQTEDDGVNCIAYTAQQKASPETTEMKTS